MRMYTNGKQSIERELCISKMGNDLHGDGINFIKDISGSTTTCTEAFSSAFSRWHDVNYVMNCLPRCGIALVRVYIQGPFILFILCLSTLSKHTLQSSAPSARSIDRSDHPIDSSTHQTNPYKLNSPWSLIVPSGFPIPSCSPLSSSPPSSLWPLLPRW